MAGLGVPLRPGRLTGPWLCAGVCTEPGRTRAAFGQWGELTTMKKVLLASDGSDNSLRAARVLGDFLGAMPTAEVTILYVAHVPRDLQMTDADGHKVLPEIPLDVMMRRAAEPVLAATASALGLPAEQVRSEVQVGEPAEEIVDLARMEQYDLVVVGSRGLAPVKEILLGSVSQRVLHTSPCPVLVVR